MDCLRVRGPRSCFGLSMLVLAVGVGLWGCGGLSLRRSPTTATVSEEDLDQVALEEVWEHLEEAKQAHATGDLEVARAALQTASDLLSNVDPATPGWMHAFERRQQLYERIIAQEGEAPEESPVSTLVEEIEQTQVGVESEGTRDVVEEVRAEYEIELDYNDRVRKNVEFFRTKGKKIFRRWLERSGRYMPMIREVFGEEERQGIEVVAAGAAGGAS